MHSVGNWQLKQDSVRFPYCMIPVKSYNDQCMQTSLDIPNLRQPDWKRMRACAYERESAARLLRRCASARWTLLVEDALPWGNLVGSREVSVLVGGHGWLPCSALWWEM